MPHCGSRPFSLHAGPHRRMWLVAIALSIIGLIALPPSATAESAASGQTAGTPGLQSVPTTKILAIGRLTPKSTPNDVAAILPQEVQDTLKLYLIGLIDQWYVMKDQTGVVFILNITTVEEARRTLEQLPLGKAGNMEFTLIPLGPLAPLQALLHPSGG
jgi:hypothetical protein